VNIEHNTQCAVVPFHAFCRGLNWEKMDSLLHQGLTALRNYDRRRP
jgi:hypothetical protein